MSSTQLVYCSDQQSYQGKTVKRIQKERAPYTGRELDLGWISHLNV